MRTLSWRAIDELRSLSDAHALSAEDCSGLVETLMLEEADNLAERADAERELKVRLMAVKRSRV